MGLKTKLLIVNIIKYICITIAVIYTFTWVTQLFSSSIYEKLNRFFGFFPTKFNNWTNFYIDILGKDIPLGYIYLSFILIMIALICMQSTQKIEFKIDAEKYEAEEKAAVKQELDRIQQKTVHKKNKEVKEIVDTKAQIKVAENINTFYGILTFNVEYLNEKTMTENIQKILKHAYSKIIVQKLKEKYGSINYAVSDKVFFICDNFSLFNLLIRDIVKLNKVISITSQKNNIKTALKLAFWASPNIKAKEACNLLLRISQLDITNKIVVSRYIQLKCDSQLIKCFNCCSLGVSKLNKLSPNDEEFDIELFYLKSSDN